MVPVDESPETSDERAELQALEEEILVLRRRLQDAPKRVRTLEERLLETKGQLTQAVAQIVPGDSAGSAQVDDPPATSALTSEVDRG